MSFGGVVLRFGSLFLRFLQFCCAAIGLGFFSYFLSVLADRDLPILNKWKAVEGITGAAVVYTIFGVVLTLCLGGNIFFGYLAVVLDVLFIGGFVAVAIMTRDGAKSCTGNVNTPLGMGNVGDSKGSFGDFGFGSGENATYAVSLGTACRFNKAVFGTAIAACLLFLITAVWQVMMVRHHKKEKAYGPSPSNNYTKGSGKTPFWKRRGNKRNTKDLETAPTGTAVRPSGETGSTVGNAYGTTEPKFGEPGYGQTPYHNRTTGNF